MSQILCKGKNFSLRWAFFYLEFLARWRERGDRSTGVGVSPKPRCSGWRKINGAQPPGLQETRFASWRSRNGEGPERRFAVGFCRRDGNRQERRPRRQSNRTAGISCKVPAIEQTAEGCDFSHCGKTQSKSLSGRGTVFALPFQPGRPTGLLPPRDVFCAFSSNFAGDAQDSRVLSESTIRRILRAWKRAWKSSCQDGQEGMESVAAGPCMVTRRRNRFVCGFPAGGRQICSPAEGVGRTRLTGWSGLNI